ncbi:hypothetical protein DICA1_E12002 [Diutina catenulata]
MNLLIISTYLWLCLALSEVEEIRNFGNIRVGDGGKAFAGLGIFEPITVQYNSDTGGAINFQVHHYNDEHRLNYGPVDVSVGSANGEPLHVDVKPDGYGFTVSGSDEFHVRVFYDGEVLGDNPRVIPGPLEVVSEGEYRKRIGFVDTGPYPVTGTLKKPTATPTPSTTTSSSTRAPISFSTPPQVTPTLEGPLTLGYSDGTFSFADATVVVGNEPEITQDGATVSIRGENEILVVSGDSVTTSPDCSSFTVAGEAVSMIKLTRYQQPYVVSGSVVVPVRLPSCHFSSTSSSSASAPISVVSELSSMTSAPESISASASHQSEWPLDELETEVYYLDPVMCERPSSSSSETSSSASSSISSEDQSSESTSSTSVSDVSSISERPSTLTTRTTRDDEKTSTSTWKLDTPTGGIDIPIPIVGGVIAGLVPIPVLICPPFCPFPDPDDDDKTITPTEATTTGPDGETITLVYAPSTSTGDLDSNDETTSTNNDRDNAENTYETSAVTDESRVTLTTPMTGSERNVATGSGSTSADFTPHSTSTSSISGYTEQDTISTGVSFSSPVTGADEETDSTSIDSSAAFSPESSRWSNSLESTYTDAGGVLITAVGSSFSKATDNTQDDPTAHSDSNYPRKSSSTSDAWGEALSSVFSTSDYPYTFSSLSTFPELSQSEAVTTKPLRTTSFEDEHVFTSSEVMNASAEADDAKWEDSLLLVNNSKAIVWESTENSVRPEVYAQMSKRAKSIKIFSAPINPIDYCNGTKHCTAGLEPYTDLSDLRFESRATGQRLPVFIVNQSGTAPGNACNTLRYIARFAGVNAPEVSDNVAIGHRGDYVSFKVSNPQEVVQRSAVYSAQCKNVFSPANNMYLSGYDVDEFPFNSINAELPESETSLLCVPSGENRSEGAKFRNFIAACGDVYKYYEPGNENSGLRFGVDPKYKTDVEFVILVNTQGVSCDKFDVGD